VWQEKITFDAIFAMVGGADLYLKVYRDRDQKAVMSPQFKQVLVEFKKLKGFVDAGSPGRNWNDATAMVVQGKAGVQIMGDWAKGDLPPPSRWRARTSAASGLRSESAVHRGRRRFRVPENERRQCRQGAKALANVVTSPSAQVAFARVKGDSDSRRRR
jgi:glucose/mannose transport system substrate-binding protein